MRDSNAAPACLLAELPQAIAKGLGPSDRRRVLRSDAAADRQHAGPHFARHVENDADIPSVAHAAGPHHGRRQRLFDRQPQAEQQRSRPIVSADAVLRSGELRAQQHLSEIVPARRKLIQDFAVLEKRGFLQVVQRA